MDPYNEIHRNRLFKAAETSFRSLEPYRNLNRGLIEEYAGSGYGNPARPRQEILLNLMNQTVEAYTMALVANRPRIMVSTQKEELGCFAQQYQLALNNYIQQIGLEHKLRQWVLDAFFCVGIIKTHMADTGQVMLSGDVWVDPGKPYASNVSVDNWVYDASATKYAEVKFAGDLYRVPHEDLKSSIYDQDVVKDIQPTSKFGSNEMRLAMVGRGVEVDQDEFEPMVDLADIWCPREGKIYTFPVRSVSTFQMYGPPVAVMDWDGPEFGPYHLLGFGDVPENVMPSSPASHLANLSRLINNLLRKQSKRSRSQKQLHLYSPSGADTAKKIQKGGDDQFIEAQNPEEFNTISVGGVDAALEQFRMSLLNEYNAAAGNPNAMLGLGPSADTVGQEQIIQGGVSNRLAAMKYRVVDSCVRLIRDLGHMLWHDQFLTIKGRVPLEMDGNYSVDMSWTPGDREGDFSDYDLQIDMHSLPYQGPDTKMRTVTDLITKIYAPMSQLLMQQGGSYDLQELTNFFAEMTNTPQLKKIVKFSSPIPDPMSQASTTKDRDVPMPSVSSRTYTRKGSPGTNQGRNVAMQQGWSQIAASQKAGAE